MSEKTSEWTDELKEEVVQAYIDAEPTPENTMDIVADIAAQYDKTPNGVRMVLTRAGKYIKKAAPTSGTSKSSSGSKRVNKAEAIDALKDAITSAGQDVDEDIVSRLTGKAAVYFTSVITAVNGAS